MILIILRLLRRISRGGKGEGDGNFGEEYQVVGNFIQLWSSLGGTIFATK